MSDLESIRAALRMKMSGADAERLIDKLLLTEGPDRGRKLSAFWVLLELSAVIACTGVLGDSTAVVIGAMIVAPLMTPILGTALSIVLADRRLIVRTLLLLAGGILSVIAVGYLIGLTTATPLLAETNSQVASRVNPRLLDLLAAIATGAVGAFATVRADVSDTLPGVAIAISLVPPLAVVGLTLESGAPDQALGALLLFGTNFAAIVATGTLTFRQYGLRPAARSVGVPVGRLRSRALVGVIGALVVLAVPLGLGSRSIVQQELAVNRATPVAQEWARAAGWEVQAVTFGQGVLHVVAIGPPPAIAEDDLRARLDAAGLQEVPAKVTLVLGGSKDLPAGQG